ncbi:Uncharacterised protein [Mycobacterium tuberculosis]|nr:Uncharacterised protein [Mycobacterium tuberculosis]
MNLTISQVLRSEFSWIYKGGFSHFMGIVNLGIVAIPSSKRFSVRIECKNSFTLTLDLVLIIVSSEICDSEFVCAV